MNCVTTGARCPCGVKSVKECNDGPNMWCAAGTDADIRKRQSGPDISTLRLLLTRARDRLEQHRDPMAAEIDKVLSE